MYATPSLLKSSVVSGVVGDSEAEYQAFMDDLVTSGKDPLGFGGKIVRQNVLPMVLFFLVMLVLLVVHKTAGRVVEPILMRTVVQPLAAFLGPFCRPVIQKLSRKKGNKVEPAGSVAPDDGSAAAGKQQGDPNMTDDYRVPLPIGEEITAEQSEYGWVAVEENGTRWKKRQWTESTLSNAPGNTEAGSFMRLWQVVDGFTRYSIMGNDRYKSAMLEMQDSCKHGEMHPPLSPQRKRSVVIDGEGPPVDAASPSYPQGKADETSVALPVSPTDETSEA